MEWLTYLRYANEVYKFVRAAKTAFDAYKNGDNAEAVHAATDMIRPIVVSAVGMQFGDSSKCNGGIASAVTGAAIDISVSAATQRRTGLVKAVHEKNILDAAAICLSDFQLGYAESKGKGDGKGKNNAESKDKDKGKENNKYVNPTIISVDFDLTAGDTDFTVIDESLQDTLYSSVSCYTDEAINEYPYPPSTAN